ncbi:MAG TPA: TetR family transcriptional regulator [Pseudonocardia sp.]|jgi:AcrR family transcriptional regulator|nr:TetR family transcriptional regulator [Pseudonocardia sp.]
MPRVPAGIRRGQLVEAAVRVAARDGVAATTTRAIATEAGTSLASVHYYFDSKQELLREVLISIINELTDGSPPSSGGGTDVATLARGELRALFEVVEREPGKQQVTYELTHHALRTEELTGLARWQYESYDERAQTRLRELASAAGAEWTLPLPVVARLLLNTIDGVVLRWLVDRDSEAALAVLDSFADTLGSLARRV